MIALIAALGTWYAISWLIAFLLPAEDGEDRSPLQAAIWMLPAFLAAIVLAYVSQWAARGLHYASCGLFPEADENPMEYLL